MKERPVYVIRNLRIALADYDKYGETSGADADAMIWLANALAEVEKERDALAGILAVVETQEHNRAVLEWGGNIMDYTHAMENGLAASQEPVQ